jgi:hypothetical protein
MIAFKIASGVFETLRHVWSDIERAAARHERRRVSEWRDADHLGRGRRYIEFRQRDRPAAIRSARNYQLTISRQKSRVSRARRGQPDQRRQESAKPSGPLVMIEILGAPDVCAQGGLAADHQDTAVSEHRGRVPVSLHVHHARRDALPCVWTVNLSRGERIARSVQPATDQDHSIAQPRDRVGAPRAGHRATRNCYSAYLHLQSPLFDI